MFGISPTRGTKCTCRKTVGNKNGLFVVKSEAYVNKQLSSLVDFQQSTAQALVIVVGLSVSLYIYKNI